MHSRPTARILALLPCVLLCGIQAVGAQVWLWPIRASEPGSNVLMDPQSIIRNAYRDVDEPFGGYVIAADEGTEVLAVADGAVVFCGYSYYPDFLTVYGDGDYETLVSDVRRKDPEGARWVSYGLGLKLGSGHVVWYTGLRAPAVRVFVTGQTVRPRSGRRVRVRPRSNLW